MTPDEHLRQLAVDQEGHVTGDQVRKAELSADQLHHRCTNAGWVRVLPDVYRLPGVPASTARFLRAAQLWVGDKGFFCRATACYIYGLDGVEEPVTLDVARYSGIRAPHGVKVHRLEPDDRPRTRLVNGLRVVNVERALVELARSRPPKLVGLALDDSLRRHLTTIERLNASVPKSSSRGRSGAPALRSLLAGRDPNDERVRTLFESRMLAILRRIRGCKVVADHPVATPKARYKLDFYLPQLVLGIECHSFRWHAGRDALTYDARRHRALRDVGIEVLYFTWDEVTFEPDAVEAEIRAAIARRRVELFSAPIGPEPMHAEESPGMSREM